MFFEGIAWAQSSAAPAARRGAGAVYRPDCSTGRDVPFALLILAFYWFFLRPQTTKAREHRDLLAKLKRNDEVVTAGGLFGRINEVGDKVIVTGNRAQCAGTSRAQPNNRALQLRQARDDQESGNRGSRFGSKWFDEVQSQSERVKKYSGKRKRQR